MEQLPYSTLVPGEVAHICTHASDARAIYIMQIDFAEFCRGQSVTAAKHA